MYGLVQGERNEVQPGKRPLSSMTPTIVTRDGRVRMVTGAPGGARIITTVLETLLNALVYGMSAQKAADAPRTHMQWLPDEVLYEPGALTEPTLNALGMMGYHLRSQPETDTAEIVLVDPATALLEGGSDRRMPAGAAIGYEATPRRWRSLRSMTRAAFQPAAPITPPPGCAAAPHR